MTENDTTETGSEGIQDAQKKPRDNEGNRLIRLAEEHSIPLRSQENQHYLAFHDQPHVALHHDGASSEGMQKLMNISMGKTNKWASSSAKALASDYLAAQCATSPVINIDMRVQQNGDVIYLDTGASNGTVIKVTGRGVEKLDSSPVTFCRSGVTRVLPDITPTAVSLLELLDFVRIQKSALPLLIASLINTWMTDMPQPVILVQGPAASGKSTAMGFLMDLIDPTTTQPGCLMKSDARYMRSLSRMRRVLVFDNVSHVQSDESDLIARITTGAELPERALYTNSGTDMIQLKRPVIINGILDGFSRSDLASRSVVFELEPIPRDRRSSAIKLAQDWEEKKSGIFTALLEMASIVLRELPSTTATQIGHRNPDLVKMTQIVSAQLDIDGVSYLESSVQALTQSVLASNPSGQAFMDLIDSYDSHSEQFGVPLSGQELLQVLKIAIKSEVLEAKLPTNPKGLGEAIKRLAGDLEAILGLRIEKSRTSRHMTYTLIYEPDAA